jgi:hypothetical protein
MCIHKVQTLASKRRDYWICTNIIGGPINWENIHQIHYRFNNNTKKKPPYGKMKSSKIFPYRPKREREIPTSSKKKICGALPRAAEQRKEKWVGLEEGLKPCKNPRNP